MSAASRHSLRLALTTPQAAGISGGSVHLEQEKWDPYTGHLTKVAALGWLQKMLFGGDAPPSNCPGDGPGYQKALYAYPQPEGLNYQAYLSHGLLTGPVIQRREFTELIQCNLDRRPGLKYPAIAINSHEWQGETYDGQGNMVPPPLVEVVDNSIRLSSAVYGSLRVSYLVCRHTYVAAVQPREEYGENKLQTYLLAVWAGGNNHLEVEAPATAEDGLCNSRWNPGAGMFGYLPTWSEGMGGGLSGDGDGDEEDDNPYRPVDGEDENRYIDYCTQEEL
jgi:hypothetical protein